MRLAPSKPVAAVTEREITIKNHLRVLAEGLPDSRWNTPLKALIPQIMAGTLPVDGFLRISRNNTLMLAVLADQPAIIADLILLGASVNCLEPFFVGAYYFGPTFQPLVGKSIIIKQHTPLTLCVQQLVRDDVTEKKIEGCLKFMLETSSRSADPSLHPTSDNLYKALAIAVSNGYVGSVKLLLAYGAKPDVRIHNVAVSLKRNEILKALEKADHIPERVATLGLLRHAWGKHGGRPPVGVEGTPLKHALCLRRFCRVRGLDEVGMERELVEPFGRDVVRFL